MSNGGYMRDESEQKCSYKLPLNPAGVIDSGERSGHWIKLRVTGIVHNLTQNMTHKFMDTPYYMSYDEFRKGGYFYTGYRNPLSLWDR
jgi:hypothetical protein